MNAVTKVALRWFTPHERATQAGLSVLAHRGNYYRDGGSRHPFSKVRHGKDACDYGNRHLCRCSVFYPVQQRASPTPHCPPADGRKIAGIAGLKHILKQKDMIISSIGSSSRWESQCDHYLDRANCQPAWLYHCGSRLPGRSDDRRIIGASILPLFPINCVKENFSLVIGAIGAIPRAEVPTPAGYCCSRVRPSYLVSFFCRPLPSAISTVLKYVIPAPRPPQRELLPLAGQISGISFSSCMDILTAG